MIGVLNDGLQITLRKSLSEVLLTLPNLPNTLPNIDSVFASRCFSRLYRSDPVSCGGHIGNAFSQRLLSPVSSRSLRFSCISLN